MGILWLQDMYVHMGSYILNKYISKKDLNNIQWKNNNNEKYNKLDE